MTKTGLAPAKINLTLHVTGRRDDGYHLLDSLVVFTELGDTLSLTPGPDLSMTVTGEFAKGMPTDERNLAWRAAQLAGWTGHIHLEKNLPHAAGIGSGSSDAGAVLRLLGADVPPDQILALGADVPVCVPAAPARMQGIGEVITTASLPDLPMLLVNPGVEVPTGVVFSGLAQKDNAPMRDSIPAFVDARACAAWLKAQRNDLETPALVHACALEDVLTDLRCTGQVLIARMSGSGATCFALYPTMKAAHMAAYEIGSAHPDWWVQATCARGASADLNL